MKEPLWSKLGDPIAHSNSNPDEWWRDLCPDDMDEDECKELASAIDLTVIMIVLGCSDDDIKGVMEQMASLLEHGGEYTHLCNNGSRITLRVSNGQLEVDTDPEVELD